MNKKTIVLDPLILVLLGLFTLAFNVHVTGAETTIIVPDDYPTIQQAVNAAPSNSKILVRAGTYAENVVIQSKSNLKLIGKDGANNTQIRGVFAGG